MILRRAVGFWLSVSVASHCFAKELAVPVGAPASNAAVIAQRLPTRDEANRAPLRGHFVVHGGEGNPGLSLLFGPLGTIAHVEMAKSQNDGFAAILAPVIATDLAAMLRSARFAGELAPPESVDGPQYELVPLAWLFVHTTVKTKAQTRSGKRETTRTLYVSCTLHVQLVTQGSPDWKARYHVVGQRGHRFSPQMDTAPVIADLQGCFDEAHRLYAGHVDRQFKTGGRYRLGENGRGMVKTSLVESEMPDRLIAPDKAGLIEYPKKYFMYALRPEQKTRR